MNVLRHMIALVLACCTSPCFTQNFNSLSEVLEIMEKSKLDYRLKTSDSEMGDLPNIGLNDHFVFQVNKHSDLEIRPYLLSPYESAALRKADENLAKPDLETAEKYYRRVLSRKPGFSPAMTFTGQTFGLRKEYREAIKWYQKAIDSNFIDYKAHWFLANTFLEIGEKDSAAREISLALTLNRNHAGIKEDLRQIFRQSGRKFRDWDFLPFIYLKLDSGTVYINCDKKWVMYACSKAVRRFEDGQRPQKPNPSSDYALFEEKEALLNLLQSHTGKNGNLQTDLPEIKALAKAVEEDYLDEFILFEIWIPRQPAISQVQPEAAIHRLADYLMNVRY